LGRSKSKRRAFFSKKKAVLSFLKAFFFVKFAGPRQRPAFLSKSLLFTVNHILLQNVDIWCHWRME